MRIMGLDALQTELHARLTDQLFEVPDDDFSV
jgi:hypothetical protein